MKLFYILFWTMWLPLVALSHPADADNQIIRGKITDKVSLLPLVDVHVEILNFQPYTFANTDADGRFRLEEVPIGRYKILCSKKGYKDLAIGIEITASRETMLNLKMEEQPQEQPNTTPDNPTPDEPKIKPVPIESGKDRPNNRMTLGSARVFSIDEVNRFAGDRRDASRSLANYAGVNIMDDFNNHLMIRGNSPSLMEWRLEGMPTLNPNHLGAFGSTGGRYNILNPSIMDNSDLVLGAMAPEYGNALSGVFDVQMRNGDDEKFHFSTQYSSASGAQVLIEGPMAKNRKASFIVGYRYGLFNYLGYALDLGLQAAGVQYSITLPQTAPQLHDLNLKMTVSAGKAGMFTLFGIGGISEQTLDGFNHTLSEKDQFVHKEERSFAQNRTFSVGLKHEMFLGKNQLVYWRNTVGMPFSQVKSINDTRISGQGIYTTASMNAFQRNLVYSSLVNRKFSKRFSLGGGGIAQWMFANIDSRHFGFDGEAEHDTAHISTALLQAFVQAQYAPVNSLRITAGVYTQYFMLSKDYSIEPRLALRWYFLPRHSIHLAGGMHSQTLPLDFYGDHNGNNGKTNVLETLDLMRSIHALLGYQFIISESWRLKLDGYYQYHYNIPISADPNAGRFSLLQYGNGVLSFPHVDSVYSGGTGQNYGAEISIEKLFDKGFYGMLNAAYTKSGIRAQDGLFRPSPYAPLYSLRLVAGKEFKIGKNKANIFSIDLKAVHYNFRYTLPLDEIASANKATTIYDYHAGYIKKLPPYFRLDVKLSFLFNSQKARLAHRLSFDFLNVTNQRNVFAYYYDTQSATVKPYYNFPIYLDVLYQLRF